MPLPFIASRQRDFASWNAMNALWSPDATSSSTNSASDSSWSSNAPPASPSCSLLQASSPAAVTCTDCCFQRPPLPGRSHDRRATPRSWMIAACCGQRRSYWLFAKSASSSLSPNWGGRGRAELWQELAIRNSALQGATANAQIPCWSPSPPALACGGISWRAPSWPMPLCSPPSPWSGFWPTPSSTQATLALRELGAPQPCPNFPQVWACGGAQLIFATIAIELGDHHLLRRLARRTIVSGPPWFTRWGATASNPAAIHRPSSFFNPGHLLISPRLPVVAPVIPMPATPTTIVTVAPPTPRSLMRPSAPVLALTLLIIVPTIQSLRPWSLTVRLALFMFFSNVAIGSMTSARHGARTSWFLPTPPNTGPATCPLLDHVMPPKVSSKSKGLMMKLGSLRRCEGHRRSPQERACSAYQCRSHSTANAMCQPFLPESQKAALCLKSSQSGQLADEMLWKWLHQYVRMVNTNCIHSFLSLRLPPPPCAVLLVNHQALKPREFLLPKIEICFLLIVSNLLIPGPPMWEFNAEREGIGKVGSRKKKIYTYNYMVSGG